MTKAEKMFEILDFMREAIKLKFDDTKKED